MPTIAETETEAKAEGSPKRTRNPKQIQTPNGSRLETPQVRRLVISALGLGAWSLRISVLGRGSLATADKEKARDYSRASVNNQTGLLLQGLVQLMGFRAP